MHRYAKNLRAYDPDAPEADGADEGAGGLDWKLAYEFYGTRTYTRVEDGRQWVKSEGVVDDVELGDLNPGVLMVVANRRDAILD